MDPDLEEFDRLYSPDARDQSGGRQATSICVDDVMGSYFRRFAFGEVAQLRREWAKTRYYLEKSDFGSF